MLCEGPQALSYRTDVHDTRRTVKSEDMPRCFIASDSDPCVYKVNTVRILFRPFSFLAISG